MYEVRYQRQATRRLFGMPRSTARRICTRIDAIAADPYGRHPNATQIQGRDRDFRLKLGGWRVIYSINDEQRVLLVAKIDTRGQIHR